MIEDVQKAFIHKFNPETLVLEFPQVVDGLQGTDTNFEMIASNTLQTLNITYDFNLISKCKAYIFVCTELMGRDEPLTEDTKVTSAVWKDIRISAMDEKKEEEKWWQNAADHDRQMCKRLIDAQKEQTYRNALFEKIEKVEPFNE